MKTSKLLATALAVLLFSSCMQENDLTPKAPEGLAASLSLKVSGSNVASTRASGTIDGTFETGEATVNRIAVLVFKTDGVLDGMGEFTAAQLTSLQTPKFSITSGTRDIYVVANAPTGAFAAVDSKTAFFAIKEDLATQTNVSLTMSGERANVTVNAGDNVIGVGADKFTISRIASRVKLSWTLPVAPSPYVGKITINEVYMFNAKTKSTYASATANTLDTSELGHGIGNDPALDGQPAGTWTALSYLAQTTSVTSGSVYFYVFENDGTTATKIIIKATYTDDATTKTVYYPITVNKANANTIINGGAAGADGDHSYVERNNRYNVSAAINGIGADSPWDEITPATLQLTVTVAAWEAEIIQAVTFN